MEEKVQHDERDYAKLHYIGEGRQRLVVLRINHKPQIRQPLMEELTNWKDNDRIHTLHPAHDAIRRTNCVADWCGRTFVQQGGTLDIPDKGKRRINRKCQARRTLVEPKANRYRPRRRTRASTAPGGDTPRKVLTARNRAALEIPEDQNSTGEYSRDS